jgi:hypothetical protein
MIEALTYAAGTESRREALTAASEAFNIGRTDVLSQVSDRVSSVVYSAVMDRGTCPPCGSADGTETQYGSPTYVALDPPNMACRSRLSGRNMCRCTWVARMK